MKELWHARIVKSLGGCKLAWIRKDHGPQTLWYDLPHYITKVLRLHRNFLTGLTNSRINKLAPGDWIGNAAVIRVERDKWGIFRVLLSVNRTEEPTLFTHSDSLRSTSSYHLASLRG